MHQDYCIRNFGLGYPKSLVQAGDCEAFHQLSFEYAIGDTLLKEFGSVVDSRHSLYLLIIHTLHQKQGNTRQVATILLILHREGV